MLSLCFSVSAGPDSVVCVCVCVHTSELVDPSRNLASETGKAE